MYLTGSSCRHKGVVKGVEVFSIVSSRFGPASFAEASLSLDLEISGI